MDYTLKQIAGMIDHALLSPALRDEELEQGCQLALRYEVAGVCIMPYYLRRCAELLAGSGVMAGTTIGFPHGGQTTAVKLAEARQAIADGGGELDMVVNIGKTLSGDWKYVKNELSALVQVTHDAGKKIKVIFENCYLTDPHKLRLCQIAGELGVDWVKTSTGFGGGGATLADVKLMRANCPSGVQVKASGGIRDLDALLAYRPFVTRVGASRTAEILDECKRRLETVR